MLKSITWIGSILVDALFEVSGGHRKGRIELSDAYRARRYYFDAVLCYTFLEQRH